MHASISACGRAHLSGNASRDRGGKRLKRSAPISPARSPGQGHGSQTEKAVGVGIGPGIGSGMAAQATKQ